MTGVLKDNIGIQFKPSVGSPTQFNPGVIETPVSGDAITNLRVQVTDTVEPLQLGEVSPLGFCVFSNEGAEDITIQDSATSQALAVLKPGKVARFQPAAAFLEAVSTATGSTLHYILFPE